MQFDNQPDPVNHPPHYTSHPSGVECIQVTEHMGFNIGNAVKFLWRADEAGAPLDDLRKAVWYIEREIARRSIADNQRWQTELPVPMPAAAQTLTTVAETLTDTGSFRYDDTSGWQPAGAVADGSAAE